MVKKRRFHITEKEAELIKTALVCGIDELERIISKEPTPYWQIMKMQMEDLLNKLRQYKWEVEE